MSFSRLKAHYTTSYSLDTELFTRDSRTPQVQALYEAARDKTEPQVRYEHKQYLERKSLEFWCFKIQRSSDSMQGFYAYDEHDGLLEWLAM